MIRHIVFFTVPDPNNLERVHEALKGLGAIPHARHFEVCRNNKTDMYANEVDLVVYAEFADWAAFHAYKADPLYSATTERVKPLRELRFAADYEV